MAVHVRLTAHQQALDGTLGRARIRGAEKATSLSTQYPLRMCWPSAPHRAQRWEDPRSPARYVIILVSLSFTCSSIVIANVLSLSQAATTNVPITSGGGFSAYFPTPSYQQAAVSAYLSSVAGKTAASGYNSMGRAYPDVSFMGNLYPVYVGGTLGYFSGTSASSPVAAAMSE